MSDILIGVSACLLGEHVRYDGGHKRNAFLLEELAPHVRFVPVCPEVGIGLGAPREAIRLVRRGDRVRLLGSAGADHTAAMRRWAGRVTGELRERDLWASYSRRAPRAAASNASACGMKASSGLHGPRAACSPRRSSRRCPDWRSRRRAG